MFYSNLGFVSFVQITMQLFLCGNEVHVYQAPEGALVADVKAFVSDVEGAESEEVSF